MHRSKCTPAEILSFPTVSISLLVLLLLCLLLLFPVNELPHRAYFRFFVEQTCHITLAVVHQHRIVLLAVGGFYLVSGRALHYFTNSKPCIHQFGGIHTGGLFFQFDILLQSFIQLGRILFFLLGQLLQRTLQGGSYKSRRNWKFTG